VHHAAVNAGLTTCVFIYLRNRTTVLFFTDGTELMIFCLFVGIVDSKKNKASFILQFNLEYFYICVDFLDL